MWLPKPHHRPTKQQNPHRLYPVIVDIGAGTTVYVRIQINSSKHWNMIWTAKKAWNEQITNTTEQMLPLEQKVVRRICTSQRRMLNIALAWHGCLTRPTHVRMEMSMPNAECDENGDRRNAECRMGKPVCVCAFFTASAVFFPFYFVYSFDAIQRYNFIRLSFSYFCFYIFFVPQNWHTSIAWTNICLEYIQHSPVITRNGGSARYTVALRLLCMMLKNEYYCMTHFFSFVSFEHFNGCGCTLNRIYYLHKLAGTNIEYSCV